MKSRIKRIVTSIALTLGLATPMLMPAMASAASIEENLCNGANLSVTQTGECTTEGAGGQVDNIIETVINIVSLVVGVISVIMIIVGGLKYITSSGESGNVTGAKNTILYAIVGLVVVALAQIIVQFVIARVNEAA